MIEFLSNRFESNRDRDALIWNDRTYTYAELLDSIETWRSCFRAEQISRGDVISVEGDFSLQAISLLIALIENRSIIVPISRYSGEKTRKLREISQVESAIRISGTDHVSIERTNTEVTSSLLLKLKHEHRPGLVLFSSGSAGNSKGAVHDFSRLLEKYRVKRTGKRILTFLLFDHIGGINTLFHALSSGGTIITVQNRNPDTVAAAIEKHHVEILPATPTFINMLLLSESFKRHDFSSLKLVTYGTEVMPETTLLRFHSIFPHIRLSQTYGLSEVGILRSKSRSSDSLWVKIGGEGFETRIVDSCLEIRAKSAMLGYLNAPDVLDPDGWIKTGDVVEHDGEYIRFLGQQSKVINVGGRKVYPAEIENVLLQMPGIREIAVSGEPNAVTGHIIKVTVFTVQDENIAEFKRRMRIFCKGRLELYKIPQKVILVNHSLVSDRFKTLR